MKDERIAELTNRLRAWGLNGFAASLLESAGPLTFLGAQALYAVGPMLNPLFPEDEVTSLARLLEDPSSIQALADHLNQESPE